MRMLISHLLQVQDQRYGLQEIKLDPWFDTIDWDQAGQTEEYGEF